MAANAAPVLTGVLRDQRRTLVLWSIAIAAVTATYVSFWPSMGEGADIEAFVENMPEGLVEALRYDQIATPTGYLRSTIYGLLGPALLLVFAIGNGARLLAGHEEDGILELEFTAPVSRRSVVTGRLVTLWLDVLLLVAVLTALTLLLVTALDMDVATTNVVAASTGLFLLVLGFGTVAFAVGAATGRRAYGLGSAAALAVIAYVLDAIGPAIDAGWMTAISPFSWYLTPNPLESGLDAGGFVLLAVIPLVAAAVGLRRFTRRDLMV